MSTVCPVCSSTDPSPLLSLGEAAVFCNVQWATREEALGVTRGRIELSACSGCGHVFNEAFDPDLVAYSPGYENSQHGSTVFMGYAEKLVGRLVDTYGLRKRAIVDLGCGRGELLTMLAEAAEGYGYGFDPSFQDVASGNRSDRVRISSDFFGPSRAREIQPALVCCRHVLEHVPDPIPFLTGLREALVAGGDTVVYLEVPNGTHLFKMGGVWDVLYEHYSYFSAHSLELALLKSGFEVLNLYEDFGSQFLCADVRLAREVDGERVANLESMGQVLPNDSALRMSDRISQWKRWAADPARKDVRSTVWGAGSKGVMFLNLVGLRSGNGPIDTVIDQNPAKDGRFVSGTGQRIALPSAEFLQSVGEVILMNSIYTREVANRLRAMNSNAKLLFADT